MNPIFSWLHLSDIHARHGDASYRANQSVVPHDLVGSLARRPAGIDRIDAIIVTGDLAFSGGDRDPGEYADVADLLGKAATALSVSRPTPAD
jgi:hypothetical protein